MGWRLLCLWQHYLFKHRREILRAGRSLADTDSYGQPDANTNGDSHTYSDVYAYADSNSNRDANGYTNGNRDSDANAKTYAHSEEHTTT
jgi:hypothetical protein